MTTNGKPIQAIRWDSEFGPPVRRHKVSRAAAPRDGDGMSWSDRLLVFALIVIFAAAAAFLVILIGGLLWLGAQVGAEVLRFVRGAR